MAKCDVSSLIGVEWEEGTSHCLSICVDGLRMMGLLDAAMSLEMNDGHGAEGWVRVDKPYAVGDLVVSSGGDGRKHLSVIYDSDRVRVLTSAKVVGAFTCPLRTVKEIEGVYRHGAG